MLTALAILAALIPTAIYFLREKKAATPSAHWPILCAELKLDYEKNPPRMTGLRNGRKVIFIEDAGGVKVSALVSKPSRLRVEIGPRAEVTKRAGVLVPDAVATGIPAFEERLLARCSDKTAATRLFDAVTCGQILAQPEVAVLCEGNAAVWRLKHAVNPDLLEPVLEILTLIADEMENHPA